MTVDRTAASQDIPTMTISFAPENASLTSSSPTGAPVPTSSTSGDKAPSNYTPTERVEMIDMKNRTADEILRDFMRVTNATPVEATAEERDQLQALEEARIRSLRDSKTSQEVRAKKKREEALLAQARGDIATQAA